MLSSIVRRPILVNASRYVAISEQSRYFRSATNREADAKVVDAAEVTEVEKPVEQSSLGSRFVKTFEVTVSKIFPAGFGWQSSSIVAENQFGYTPESVGFALTTGFGDFLGVLIGHCSFYGLKKATVDDSIIMQQEFETGLWLASAAFCSGAVWQPCVNVLQGANLSFNSVFIGTWIGCGAAFYTGLRIGRTILPNFTTYIEESNYDNAKSDRELSVAIGGATGFFVGTDAAYLPDQNFLIDVVGIKDGTPDLTGCAIAGTSTALGFLSTNSVFNCVYPRDKLWID